jgi:hypothetical protein
MDSEGTPVWAQQLIQQQAHQMRLNDERVAQLEAALREALETNQLKDTDTTPTPSTTRTTEDYRRPRPRLPDPTKFNGDSTEWSTWKVLMENKLMIDKESIGPEQAQFLYVFSRLEGNAGKNVTTYVKQRREEGTAQDLLAYLETLYGDPNAVVRAATRLHQLKQGDKQSFAKFVPILEKEFAEAGALEWPDDAKRPILLGALNEEMSKALVSRGIPRTFQEIVNRLHEISTDLDMLNIKKSQRSLRSTNNATVPQSPLVSQPEHDPMDWSPTPSSTVSAGRATPNPRGYASKRPEDAPLVGKRAKWVPKGIIDTRRAEGRCLRCGRDGCRVRTCPLSMAVNPRQDRARSSVNRTTARPPVIQAEFDEEGFSSDDGSGKD